MTTVPGEAECVQEASGAGVTGGRGKPMRIPGFPDYVIFPNGVVRNVEAGRDVTVEMTGFRDPDTESVRLFSGGNRKRFVVHKLLTTALLHHIDTLRADKTDTDATLERWGRELDAYALTVARLEADAHELRAENARLKEREVQALKGDLLDELGQRGWMLMCMSTSGAIVTTPESAGSVRPANKGAWRVKRENYRYSYGDTPELAILTGLADDDHERNDAKAHADTRATEGA